MNDPNRLEFTLVVGVDGLHLEQLRLTWPTWKRHKPSTVLGSPMIVFYDSRQVDPSFVREVVDHPNLSVVPWPFRGLLEWKRLENEVADKFNDPHRAMMLSGFVYVPAICVRTRYWLKLDTDVVATGMDDWIDPRWFEGDPAIVSHRWSFTKPADQMLRMDRWVEENRERMPPEIAGSPPLNLVPNPGSDRVGHKRIISWCAFFDTAWTKKMAELTHVRDGYFQLPVPSQDGFLWYMARRGGRKIVRADMKSRGFSHWNTWESIARSAREALER